VILKAQKVLLHSLFKITDAAEGESVRRVESEVSLGLGKRDTTRELQPNRPPSK